MTRMSTALDDHNSGFLPTAHSERPSRRSRRSRHIDVELPQRTSSDGKIRDLNRRLRAGDGPAWRWNRANDLIIQKTIPDAMDDAPTIALWSYFSSPSVGSETTSMPSPELFDSNIAQAHEIYAANEACRWELEARILSGVSVEEMAGKIGIGPSLVKVYQPVVKVDFTPRHGVKNAVFGNLTTGCYASAFFDVVDRLGAKDWIWRHAIGVGPWFSGQLAESDIWRYVAFSGGPAILDFLISDHKSLPIAAYAEQHELAEDIRATVRILTAPMNDKKAFGPLMKRMWRILANRITVKDTAKWESLADHLENLEAVANLRTKRTPRKHSKPRQKCTLDTCVKPPAIRSMVTELVATIGDHECDSPQSQKALRAA